MLSFCLKEFDIWGNGAYRKSAEKAKVPKSGPMAPGMTATGKMTKQMATAA